MRCLDLALLAHDAHAAHSAVRRASWRWVISPQRANVAAQDALEGVFKLTKRAAVSAVAPVGAIPAWQGVSTPMSLLRDLSLPRPNQTPPYQAVERLGHRSTIGLSEGAPEI